MLDNNRSDSPSTKAELLGGIVNDAQQLLKQEVALARREILDELTKAKVAALSMAGAACLIAFAAAFLILGALHWLQWLTQLPLWACYLMGAAILGLAGTVLFLLAKHRANHIELAPQTVETMKENLKWIQNQV